MNALPPDPFPRGPLRAIALLLFGVIVAVAAVRLSGVPIRAPDAPAVLERLLRFEDRPDGSIAVSDTRTGRALPSIEGESGFVRGTLRGLARERRRQGVAPEAPFRLVGRADGRLTLEDPGTGRRVDLESFGPTNAATFAALLTGDR